MQDGSGWFIWFSSFLKNMGSVCRMSWIISTPIGVLKSSAFAGPAARDISSDINLADQAISKEKAERVKVQEAGKHEWDEPWRQFLNAQKWAEMGWPMEKVSPHFLSHGFMGKL